MYAVTLSITFVNHHEMKSALAKMPSFIGPDVRSWLKANGQLSYDTTVVEDPDLAKIVMSYRFEDEASYEKCWKKVWGRWDDQDGPRQLDKRSINKGPVIFNWNCDDD